MNPLLSRFTSSTSSMPVGEQPNFFGCALRSVEHNVTGPGQKEDNQSKRQSCSLFPISL